MWGRAVVVALVVLGTAGVATAGKKRKVRILSEPTGAIVYINDENEPDFGVTPCNIELPPGNYDVILKLNEYQVKYAQLVVPKPANRRDKKLVEMTYMLQKAMATVQVDNAPARAKIVVDDNPPIDAEEYAGGFDVTAGQHIITVDLDGNTLLNQSIEIASGEFLTLTVRGKVGSGVTGDVGDPAGDGPPGSGGGVTRKAQTKGKRDGPIFSVGPLVEFGWRDFQYQGDTTSDTLPITQAGAALIGLAIDINPFRLTGFRPFHPLAIVLAGGFGVPQSVSDESGAGLGADLETFWQRFQAGLRYRFGLGAIDLDLEAGYASYIYRFSGSGADIDRVPDAAYQTVRFGGRLGVRIGSGAIAPYVGGENRVVLSGGALEDRFRNGSDTQGFGFRGGVDLRLWGRFAARLEGNYSRFEWTFTPTPPMYMATGGTDTLYGFGFVLGYAY